MGEVEFIEVQSRSQVDEFKESDIEVKVTDTLKEYTIAELVECIKDIDSKRSSGPRSKCPEVHKILKTSDVSVYKKGARKYPNSYRGFTVK